jgi:hypothetical protein
MSYTDLPAIDDITVDEITNAVLRLAGPDELSPGRGAAIKAWLDEGAVLSAGSGAMAQAYSEMVRRLISAAKPPEEIEAREILERVAREIAPLEERIQRLMHQYGL